MLNSKLSSDTISDKEPRTLGKRVWIVLAGHSTLVCLHAGTSDVDVCISGILFSIPQDDSYSRYGEQVPERPGLPAYANMRRSTAGSCNDNHESVSKVHLLISHAS